MNGLEYEVLPPRTLKDYSLPKSFDIGLVASIGYFIPGRLIRSFSQGIINAHPSLLPKYRGASPLQYTIMKGDTEGGVSIMDLDPKTFDAGNIWLQRSEFIGAYSDFRSLEERFGNLSGILFHEILNDWEKYKTGRRPQSEEGLSYAPKITRNDAQVSFLRDRALGIFGKYRALRHQESIHCVANGKEVILVDIEDPRQVFPSMPAEKFQQMGEQAGDIPGSVFLDRSARLLWIKTVGDWLPVKKFRIQGKSTTFDAPNFANAVFGRDLTNFSKSLFC